ncbi:glycosyltransferase [Ornithinibacillus californiensis]|uniref:glycosyltransferase n=1 Tax=Ornithinibacillus californiensis TaxID=161536 RepID=UPI00064D7DFE|nr:glycosyltransferase [Ornithinibacillus californiensis]
MKKKILFMVINMNIGGTEKALLNLIEEMPEEQYDITILMLEKYGGFLEYIPERVNVKYLEDYPMLKGLINNPPKQNVINLFKKGKLLKGFYLGLITIISKVTRNNIAFYKYLLRKVPQINDEYDIAVAYAGPMDFISYFIVYKVKADKKIQWIHFDVNRIGFNKRFAGRIYKHFYRINVVSSEGKEKLVSLLPMYKEKISTYANTVSSNHILNMANQGIGFQDNFDGIRILTVGRLSKEKGQELAISVLELLKRDGLKIRWYCIGEGKAREEYEKSIKERSLTEDFILLGANPNPYPYMRQCNLYVQPSKYEGFCITLSEAKCFGIPIICTEFTGAREQLVNYSQGYIVEYNKIQLYQSIKQITDKRKI